MMYERADTQEQEPTPAQEPTPERATEPAAATEPEQRRAPGRQVSEQRRASGPESESGSAERPQQSLSVVDMLLMGVVAVFLAAYAWPILQPGMGPFWRAVCFWTSWITWGVFALDYVVRLVRAEDRWTYVKRNLFALATVLLPFFRPLRMLRLLTVMSVLNRRATVSLRGQVTTYAAGATGLLMFCGALAALEAERGAEGANIDSFGNAVWWAFATVTTVGYGDHYPVTGTGRLIAVLLMIAGIAVLGVVSAALASWFIERVSAAGADQEAATRQEIKELTEVIGAQQRQLEEQRALLLSARAAAGPGDQQPVPDAPQAAASDAPQPVPDTPQTPRPAPDAPQSASETPRPRPGG